MRTIKFRGKSLLKGKWIYGHLLDAECGENLMIQVNASETLGVDDNTVGQFTGLYDKNGKEIYEGDLIEVNGRLFGVVEWHKDGYFFINDTIVGIRSDGGEYSPIGEMIRYFSNQRHDFSIIGNIHDNPELVH